MHEAERDEAAGAGGTADGGSAAEERRLSAELHALFPGGVPNLYRAIGRNPRVLAALVATKRELEGGVLTAAERCLVAIEVARDADCHYCLAALDQHGRTDLGIGDAALSAAACESLPDDPRLALVVRAARALIASKGRLGRAEIGWFVDHGLDRAALLEIIAVISEYTLATYAANLDRTRIDPDYRAS